MSKAFVFLNCDLGTEKYVVDEMKNISGVSQASTISGIYDIVAEVDTESENGISRIVKKFRSIANIRSCLTMIVADKHDAAGDTAK
ncbi:MAG TPA: Lrp/AsnC ligand binding domain-containing protein [Nitrososphaera sp.]|nr:Lrp/AsnC ligand binding domain-containing protein [Nitrososphaera sp.]